MAVNFPGPYELRFFYTCTATPGDALVHQMRFNINLQATPSVGAAFSTITAVGRLSNTRSLDDLCEDIEALLAPLFNAAGTTFDYWELWSYEEGTFNATYISTYDATDEPEGVTSLQKASQLTLTWRTQEGGVMKNVQLEGMTAPAVRTPYADLNAANQAWVDFFTDDADSFFLGRDTSYPVVFLAAWTGQNEKTFRQRYR